MIEDIDLTPEQEAALDRVWAKQTVHATTELIHLGGPVQEPTQQTFPPSPTTPTLTAPTRVTLDVIGDAVTVALPDALPFTVRRGQAFAGWTWAELTALGKGTHTLTPKG